MDTQNLMKVIISVIVGVVLFSAILVPTVGTALVTAGDEITKTNTTAIVLREVESGDVLKCTSTYDTDTSTRTNTWTLNDEEITNLSGSAATWNVGIMSDGMYLQIYDSSNNSIGLTYGMSDVTTARYESASTADSPEITVTITFGDGTISYEKSTGYTATYDYTWGYVLCPYDEGEYCAAVSGGVGYVSDASDVILCGAYTSGELDTMYSYKDGTTYVSNSAYTMTADIDLELTEGTTDIYTATVSVDMSDGTSTETFTPYRILLPYEVEGHADSGANYSLISIIPLLVLVGLVLGAVGAFISRRD